MGEIAIRAEKLSKQYHIGGPQKTYSRLGDQIVDVLSSPFRRASKLLRGQASGVAELDETIWALKDVSFEVSHGEVVGIIGRNGAGKSTLLKILSRITEPTEGFADLYGRVGSLLEVGTGFHPELTGRENVYMNGAILGMRKAEIARKFDEIVAFSEIDKFIDTPVKHYSSGMYVRLAFSVAAHLEPEILLVDEVLAVGDVAFQRKCLGKMDEVSRQGRTVMFVSHNMGLIQTLCQRGIYLENGEIACAGSVAETVEAYLQSLETANLQEISERVDRRGEGKIKLVGLEVTGANGRSSILKTGEPAHFAFHVDGYLPDMDCSFSLFDHLGQRITTFRSSVHGPEDVYEMENKLQFACEIDQLMLMPGRYRMDVGVVGDNRLQDYIQAAAFFEVAEGHLDGRPTKIDVKNKRVDFSVYLPHRWRLPPRNR
jgi:lipopolysaccharide transport system ATP-binding protein